MFYNLYHLTTLILNINNNERTKLNEKVDFFKDNILPYIDNKYLKESKDYADKVTVLSMPYSSVEKRDNIYFYSVNVINRRKIYSSNGKLFYIYYGSINDYAYLVSPKNDDFLVDIGYCKEIGKIDNLMMDLLEQKKIRVIAKLKIL